MSRHRSDGANAPARTPGHQRLSECVGDLHARTPRGGALSEAVRGCLEFVYTE